MVSALRKDESGVGVLAVDPSRRSRVARCSATASGCRTTPPTTGCSSVDERRADTSADCRPPSAGAARARRGGCDVILVETVGVGQPRSRSPRWPTRPSCCSRRVWATASRRRRPASSRSRTSRGDKADRERRDQVTRACATCSRWADGTRLRARGGRHRETVASTGDGMPDVLAALDKHRSGCTAAGEFTRRRQARAAPRSRQSRSARSGPVSATCTARRRSARRRRGSSRVARSLHRCRRAGRLALSALLGHQAAI